MLQSNLCFKELGACPCLGQNSMEDSTVFFHLRLNIDNSIFPRERSTFEWAAKQARDLIVWLPV